MKKIIVMTCLGFVTALSSIAQDNSNAATERANRLTEQMIRDLRLNNFQANKIRAINEDKVNKMMAIENKYADDPNLVEKSCQGVCKERDKEVESFLSTDQYSKYYASRSLYYKNDKDFAARIGATATAKTKNDKKGLPIGKKVIQGGSKTTTVIKQDDSK